MAELMQSNLKGTTLIETLFAMVIIALAFGFSITFLSNKPYAKNLKSYRDSLELRKWSNAENFLSDYENTYYQTEEIIFMDSLCVINKITIEGAKNQSMVKIKFIEE